MNRRYTLPPPAVCAVILRVYQRNRNVGIAAYAAGVSKERVRAVLEKAGVERGRGYGRGAHAER